MKSLNGHNKTSLLIATIVAAVLILAAVLIFAQQSYSHKIKSIEITKSTGPVAPEYQQTQSIVITKDSCIVKTTKVISNETTSANCQSKTSNFDDLQKKAAEYDVINKIIANGKGGSDVIGGGTLAITITLQNGDSFSTESGTDFSASIEPFLNQIPLSYNGIDKL